MRDRLRIVSQRLALPAAQAAFAATSGVFVLTATYITVDTTDTIVVAWNFGLIFQIIFSAFFGEAYVLAARESSDELLAGVRPMVLVCAFLAGASTYWYYGDPGATALFLSVGTAFSTIAVVSRLLLVREGKIEVVLGSDMAWLLATAVGAALAVASSDAGILAAGWAFGAATAALWTSFEGCRSLSWGSQPDRFGHVKFRLNVTVDVGLAAALPAMIALIAAILLSDQFARTIVLFFTLTGPTNIAVSYLRLRTLRMCHLIGVQLSEFLRSARAASIAAAANGVAIVLLASALVELTSTFSLDTNTLNSLAWPIGVVLTFRKAAGSAEAQLLAFLVVAGWANFVGRWRLLSLVLTIALSCAAARFLGEVGFVVVLAVLAVAGLAAVSSVAVRVGQASDVRALL